MPFLHWDLAHQLQRRNACIQLARERRAVGARPSIEVMSQYAEDYARKISDDRIDTKNEQADNPYAVMTRHELELRRYRRLYTVDELALLGYLNVVSPIHPRRTLDHSRYPTLDGPDIENRDRDQVVYRHTKSMRLKPRLIMVDQLWMWIIDGSEFARLAV